jgi:hypothetical protein
MKRETRDKWTEDIRTASGLASDAPVSNADIVKAWNENGRKASSLGTAMHKYAKRERCI